MPAMATESEPTHGSQGWKLIDFEVFDTVDGPVGRFEYQRLTGGTVMDHGYPRAETETRYVERAQRPRFWDRLGTEDAQ